MGKFPDPCFPLALSAVFRFSGGYIKSLKSFPFLVTLVVLQLFYLSGILTVFFCGIVMSHYTWHNVTESSRVTTKYVFHGCNWNIMIWIFFLKKKISYRLYPCLILSKNCHRHAFATLSFVAEIFIFLYVGMDALDIEKWRFVSNTYVLSAIVEFI